MTKCKVRTAFSLNPPPPLSIFPSLSLHSIFKSNASHHMSQHPNTLVVAVDTQYDFMLPDGRLPVKGAEQLLVPGQTFLANLDARRIAGVLFTFDSHTQHDFIGSAENIGDASKGIPGFPLHCELGTPGWHNALNPHLVPQDIPVYTLRKSVFDMWEQPSGEVLVKPLEARWCTTHPPLADQGEARDTFFPESVQARSTSRLQHIDTIVVFGVAADFCVKWAINGFLARGFNVAIVEDLTKGIARDMAQTIRQDFGNNDKVKLVKAAQV